MSTPTVEPAARYWERRRRASAAVAEAGHSALLVTDLSNIRYLTGFSGSNGVLLLRGDGSSVLATDGRYTTQVRLQTGKPEDMELHIGNDLIADLRGKGIGDTPAVEPSMPVRTARTLGDPEILSGCVEKLRLLKDEQEVAALLAAGELADSVWVKFLADGCICEGRSEREAAAELEFRLRSAGAERLSFDTILASGPNAAKPHAGVSGDRIVPGLVTVDFGIYLDGYASDQTRTVCVGEPDATSREIFDIVQASQAAGAALVAPGVQLRAIDSACRRVIEDAGYGEYFVHSTGHGVGLDVHEAPAATSRAADTELLQAGNTLTVEPGIYLPGRTGLRLENTYVVTADGARSCNPSPLDLVVV